MRVCLYVVTDLFSWSKRWKQNKGTCGRMETIHFIVEKSILNGHIIPVKLSLYVLQSEVNRSSFLIQSTSEWASLSCKAICLTPKQWMVFAWPFLSSTGKQNQCNLTVTRPTIMEPKSYLLRNVFCRNNISSAYLSKSTFQLKVWFIITSRKEAF